MASGSHTGLKWIMRGGYGARGVIYTIIGGLSIYAALTSAQVGGTQDSLGRLRSAPLGQIMLAVIAAGLFAYLIWRVVDAALDLEDHGTDAKGLLGRAGQVVTGVFHGAIGVSVAGLAFGFGGGGDGAQGWTRWLLSQPLGRVWVAAAALILGGAGIYYIHKGWTGHYKSHLRCTALTERIDPALTFGLAAHGVLIMLIGLSLGAAALDGDPQRAGGLGQALDLLRGMVWGRVALGAAGVGLLGYALYNFIEAGYRVVPRFSGPDVRTLAQKASL